MPDRDLFGRLDTSPASIGAKVAHVKRAGQTRTHECHWPGCQRQVPPAKWGCLEHWRKLPKPIRDEIWRTYQIGQETTLTPSREYIAAARKAQDWICEQATPAGGEALL